MGTDFLEQIQKKASHINTLDDLKAKFAFGRPLRVKYSIDPTDFCFSHVEPLRLLRQFQEVGHKAVVVYRDCGAGDLVQARKNSVLFRQEVAKVLICEANKCEEHLNSGWLERMSTRSWIDIMKHWTVQQMTEKCSGQLSELLYLLMQAEDSVRVEADIELGKELFTLNLARDWQRINGQEPQVCIVL